MATVCEWFGLKTTQTVFIGLASKPVATVPGGLTSKSATTVSSGLASKPAAMIFSGLTSKLVATVFSSLASKLVATISPNLTSKPVVGFLVEPQNQGGEGFSQFGPQNLQLRFDDLGFKITATVSWFGPQNHVGFGLSVAPQNRWKEVGTRHASRFSGLLDVEASQTRISQSDLKTTGGDDGWCTWHHRGGCVRVKLKSDRSMRCATSDPATPPLLFLMY
jgi:hypothetical protein